MDKKILFIIPLILISSIFGLAFISAYSANPLTEYTYYWEENNTFIEGISFGQHTSPDVFYWGDNLNLITGDGNGVINGYTWNGTSWVSNSTILNGVGFPGTNSHVKPHFFNISNDYYLLLGLYSGMIGYAWNGTSWVSNSTIVPPGIISSEGFADYSPTTFNLDDNFHLFIGKQGSLCMSYLWNGSGWSANTTMNASSPNICNSAYNTPEAFYFNDTLYVIRGTSNSGYYGTPNAYSWGPVWALNYPMKASIDTVAFDSFSYFEENGNSWLLSSTKSYKWVLEDESPDYSSVSINNTKSLVITQFGISFSDNAFLNPLGQYIFSTNNTGEWVNDTAVNITPPYPYSSALCPVGTLHSASSTIILNDTIGTVVGYRWYFDDNAGNTNLTQEYTLTTTDGIPPYFADESYYPSIDVTNPYGESWSTEIEVVENIAFDSVWLNDTSIFSIEYLGYFDPYYVIKPSLNSDYTSVGHYSSTIYVNDTYNNINSTILNIEITKSTSECGFEIWDNFEEPYNLLYNQGDLPDTTFYAFPIYINSICSQASSDSSFYINGTEYGFFTEINLEPGIYNFTIIRNDSSNFENYYFEETFTIKENYPAIITLLSPATYSNQSNLTGDFVAYVGTNQTDIGITNVSLIFNGAIVSTNTTGIANDTYYFSNTLINATHYSYFDNWSIIAYTNYSIPSQSVTRYVKGDISPPYLTVIPANVTQFYDENKLVLSAYVYTGFDTGTNRVSYSSNDSRWQVQTHFSRYGHIMNTTSVAVGDYEINVTYSDSIGNLNFIPYRITINQSVQPCNIYVNDTTKFVWTDCSSDYVLTVNNTPISNASTITLGAGYYNLTVQRNDAENYTYWTDTEFLTIPQVADPCSIYSDKVTPQIYPNSYTIYTDCTSDYTLTKDGTPISNGTTYNLGIGTSNFTVQRTDDQNYTNIYDSVLFTITPNPSLCQVLFDKTSPLNYPDTFTVWSNCDSLFTLMNNGVPIVNNSVQALNVGTYNFSVQRTDTENYTNTYSDASFIILEQTEVRGRTQTTEPTTGGITTTTQPPLFSAFGGNNTGPIIDLSALKDFDAKEFLVNLKEWIRTHQGFYIIIGMLLVGGLVILLNKK